MSEALVIRLDAAAAGHGSWVAVDPTGALLGEPRSGELAEAAPAAANRQVVALVPAADVLRTRAEVPVKSGNRLLQALPFALEDQLAEDVEQLHFAAGGRDDEGRVAVAAVRRDRMTEWAGSLAAAGLTPQRMYSEADAVQAMPNTATLMVHGDGAVLTEPDGAASAMDTDSVGGLLTLWLARRAGAEPDAPPPHLVVYGSAPALGQLDALWEDLRPQLSSLDLRELADGPLPRLAAQIVTQPGVNLLQGEFARRTGFSSFWPAWRLTAVLLAAWLLIGVAADWAELRRTRAAIAQADGAIGQAFNYVFPGMGPITDPRAQLSSQLQRLGAAQGGGSSEFLDMLRLLAQAIGGNPAVRLEALSYRSGSLELRLKAPDVGALDQVQKKLVEGGWQAQIQSANPATEGVVGRLQITRSQP
jgi:general secretion pathway protein L